MKRCPACGRTFTNNTLVNCLNDGTALVEDVPAPPPYFGAPSAETPSFAETPPSFAETPPSFAETPPSFAEMPPSALPSEVPSTVTYTNTPLSAIPELQSPQIQAALKEALDKAGLSGLSATPAFQSPQMQAAMEKALKKAEMSGLLDAGSLKPTISVTTSITSQSGTPFATGTVPPGYVQTPPSYSAAAPRRNRSPWGRLFVWLLILLAVITGYRYFRHKADVPADVVAAVKNADAAEVSAVRTLDPRPLASAYAGPALARELKEVASLKNAHQTQEDHLAAQEFSAFQPSADGSKAQVDVTETWDTTVYSEPGHTVENVKTGDVNPQTVYLTRTPSGWRVEKIDFHHS